MYKMSTKAVRNSVVKSSKTVQKVTITTVRSYSSIEIKRKSATTTGISLKTAESSFPRITNRIGIGEPLKYNSIDAITSSGQQLKTSKPLFDSQRRPTEVKTNRQFLPPRPISSQMADRSVPVPKYESAYRNSSPLFKRGLDTKVTQATYVSPYRGTVSTVPSPRSSHDTNYERPTFANLRPTRVYQADPPRAPATSTSFFATKSLENLKKGSKKSKLKPGHVYIFNNEKFDDPQDEDRVGSEGDVKRLQGTFEKFKMSVEVFRNFTVKQIKNQMTKIEKKDFSKKSAVIIVIMSHGNRLETVKAKDGLYSIDDDVMFPVLRNTTLEDKPKILIIQACKGEIDLRNYKTDSSHPLTCSPSEILKFYSTFEGYVSYRSSKGTVFIITLCDLIQRFGATKCIKDIMQLCTTEVKKATKNMQVPTIHTTLTNSFILGDYI